uniref:Poly [ADP-ribose] polymerase n=1 Tax=Arion vulgaris TaxID=1028688 RepID=A0A0B6ZRX6_9EUPU
MASKMAGLGMALQEPEPLAEQFSFGDHEETEDFSLVPVSSNENIYKEIFIDFENADIAVVKVERLKNPHLWKRYVTERDLMSSQRTNIDPGFKLNEKYLYHGTSALKSYICEEGLDSRMSKRGCFGKGIYFSDYPRKCVKYAEKGESGASFILLMRVILGTPKVYEKGKKDRELVREPEKTSPYTGYRFYDSVEGCPVNHKEFVVYESRRALVECIISYTKKDINKPLPITQTPSTAKKQLDSNDLDSDFSDSDNEFPERPNDLHGQDGDSSEEENIKVYSSEANNVGVKTKASNESAEDLLTRKKEEFRRKTGVMDDYVVDHYLLKGNLNVSKAIQLYNDRSLDEEQTNEDESPIRSTVEADIALIANKPEQPTPGSPAWDTLSEADKEEVIKSLIDDFLNVTGLTDDDGYARLRLSKVGYNLDLAVLSHYEEM